MTIRYPYARPGLSEADIQAVANSLTGQFLTQGPQLEAFESELCTIFGARHAVVCNSGTAALHLVYMALDLGPERGLLTSPVTFLATANAARMCQAPVAFSDVDASTGNMTPETLADALERASIPVAAVTAVHLGGRACDMAGLRKAANEHGLALIEDASHAPLADYHDGEGGHFSIGSCAHSDAAIFSFHAIKHLAMGEGGAVLTNDDRIAARCRLLLNHGMNRNAAEWRFAPEPDAPWYYEMSELGWNYRACEMQCALGLSQLGALKKSIEKRRGIAGIYDRLLAGFNLLSPPPPDPGQVWHLYPVSIDFEAAGRTRGEVMRALADDGVGTQVHYIPLHHQPYYRRAEAGPLPGAEQYYRHTLSIPMYPGLGEADLEEIAGALKRSLSGG